MNFTNTIGWYINLILIQAILCEDLGQMEDEGIGILDGKSEDVCLPLEVDAHVEHRAMSGCKLLYYVQMHNGGERENIKYIIKEVFTTYNILVEIQHMFVQLMMHEQRMRPLLWMWSLERNYNNNNESNLTMA